MFWNHHGTNVKVNAKCIKYFCPFLQQWQNWQDYDTFFVALTLHKTL